jgi:hypothetical protein
MRSGAKLLHALKAYRITSFGRKAAKAEAARMRELVQLAAASFGAPKHA